MAQFSLPLNRNDHGPGLPRALRTLAAPVTPVGNLNPLDPIGIGKPLTVELVYAVLGESVVFSTDMLLCSMVKKIPVYEAAPRAINALVRGVKPRFQKRIDHISAGNPWTPVIYHTKSQVERSIAVSVEATFDKYDDGLVQQVAGLMQSAAGMPLFAPASLYLTAGATILKIASRLIEKLVDGRPFFSDTLTISIDAPGQPDSAASFQVLYQNSVTLDRMLRSGELVFDVQKGLVHADTNSPFDGPDQYVVLLVYGNDRTDFDSFSPTMASAALLDRFLHAGESASALTDDIKELLLSSNDLYYRKRAADTIKQLQNLEPGSPDYEKQKAVLKAQFDAIVKNINDKNLRPTWP